jgi:hypothetical protein
MIIQRKTGRPVQFEVTEQTWRSNAAWLTYKRLAHDDWLFPSRSKAGAHLSTPQYARLTRTCPAGPLEASGKVRHAKERMTGGRA